jgi:N-acetylmuramoyl-L-alanine amidase
MIRFSEGIALLRRSRSGIGWGIRVIAWGLLVGLLAGSTPVQAEALLTNLSVTARADGQGYVVRAQTTTSVKAYGMPRRTGQKTLEWRLYNTRRHADFESPEPVGPVTRYSVVQEDGHLVLRFHLTADRPLSLEAYRDGASSDLLLNLAYENGQAIAEASSSSPQQQRNVQTASARPAPAARGASKEARERWQLDTVVIDAGHGGKDPGAVANGLYEKDIVLDVALQVGEYIENRLGVNVEYTRTSDRFIPLEKRGSMANKAEAKLFLSLHVNAARATSARGTETYFLGPSKSDAARKVMERENSVIRYEDNTDRYEQYDEQALVRQTLTQSAYMRQSEQLASLVQSQFEERVHRKNRGVHQAGFYVLWSASMPAVLVELGFLSNPQEARYLSSDQGKTYLASALFRAVRAYKKQYEKGIVAQSE